MSSFAPGRYQKQLTYETLCQEVKICRYDVRGEIYLAAVKRANEGKEVIYTNVGNPHALGQAPITFIRQVLALCMAPFLLEHPSVTAMFPSDAIARARLYLASMKGGLGSYSDSRGHPIVRQEIAQFISRKNDVPMPSIDNIFIQNGASECVRLVLRAIIRGSNDGIMVPIPQYPLYSASIALFGGALIGYYLDEENGWSMDMAAIQKSLDDAKLKGICPRALVFINPGNPTGTCLSEPNMRDLLTFCYHNRLVLLADEVYQENIYLPEAKPFISARRVLHSPAMPRHIANSVELFSFHSISKGPYGECGLRGGYFEAHNIDPVVIDEIYKTASINLSPNIPGQVAMGLMVNPPKEGDVSFHLYHEERLSTIQSLQRRARFMTDGFNALDGIVCQQTEGAMYSFPRIILPPKAVEAARKANKAPDVYYCLALLQETGISTVPGSGFQQKDGTYHLRTTILPSEDKFKSIMDKFSSFHNKFMKEHGASASFSRSKL